MENLAMGGYGAYVWTCFGLTFVVLLINEFQVRDLHAKTYRDVEVRIKAQEDTR